MHLLIFHSECSLKYLRTFQNDQTDVVNKIYKKTVPYKLLYIIDEYIKKIYEKSQSNNIKQIKSECIVFNSIKSKNNLKSKNFYKIGLILNKYI